ncbi:MAG: hypothetical protein ACREIS_13955, partial [Nitrospiraceae bacterium]
GLGLWSAHALSQVDQDLRIIYTEYTLGAVDLAHISADVMRYRNTVLRALEAQTKKDYDLITSSLPDQRARIQHAVDRYAAASLRVSRSGRSEPEDIQAVRDSLDAYFSAASRTIAMLNLLWVAGTPQDATELRTKAEVHAAEIAGAKLIQVSLALDHLLETVAEVAKDKRDEGTKIIRRNSAALIVVGFLIALFNLFLIKAPAQRASGSPLPTRDEHPEREPPVQLPMEPADPLLRRD